jgi:endonuclease YncB( thermonuclease family)
MRKVFGFAVAWTVCEQNRLLAFFFSSRRQIKPEKRASSRPLSGLRQSLRQALIEQGMASVYHRYCQNSMILSLEAEARAARRSLWQNAHPTVPQCWRNHAEKGRK